MSTNSSPTFIRTLRYIHALFGITLTILVLGIVTNVFFLTFFVVDGQSMEPTLQDRHYLGVDLTTYRFKEPQKNDIVIVSYAGDSTVRFVKRILGVPGETVQVRGEDVVLTTDQYYVVGDNRDYSTDSRVFGPINRNDIFGRVFWH